MEAHVPTWNLKSVYEGFDSAAYERDVDRLDEGGSELVGIARRIETAEEAAPVVAEFIGRWNEIADIREQLDSYAYCTFSTNTEDARASKELNRIEALNLPLQNALTLFRSAVVAHTDSVGREWLEADILGRHRFFLDEQLEFARHQMDPDMEDLAADLARSGADAWTRLHEATSSTLSVEWEHETGERKTVNELRALAFSTDRAVRERAFRREIEAWKSMETPLAYCLNGVKGSGGVLTKRRGYRTALDPALKLSRISQPTINALIGAMKSSLPGFRDYFRKKAVLLGVDRLRFYDLFAPVGASSLRWTFEDAKLFVCDQFSGYSERLGRFAEHAFDAQWIDARTRNGKVGGAYCISFPTAKESRILCNFDGSLSSVLTIAHELGHAYHHEVLKDASHIDRDYPMTLAETASIFCELIVINAAIRTSGDADRTVIAEQYLQDAGQIIVDILSRYLFETSLFSARVRGELSPEELCGLMTEAQQATYGDGLDPEYLHPYMWAVKGHYYSQNLPFYNFPYAFGMLFGSGLYRLYTDSGDDFVETYDELLGLTGSMTANDLTRRVGFDIESEAFWRNGIDQALSFTSLL